MPRAVVLGRAFARAATALDGPTRAALARTLHALETDPALPGPGDLPTAIPPVVHGLRRRVGASAWWVYYELRPDRVVLISVAIPP